MDEYNTFNYFGISMAIYPSVPIKPIFNNSSQLKITPLSCNNGFRCGGYYDKKIIQELKVDELIRDINTDINVWYNKIINKMK